ncbi:acyl carrier protein [bacterium]|nr:acyl carrier protein [bacterium]
MENGIRQKVEALFSQHSLYPQTYLCDNIVVKSLGLKERQYIEIAFDIEDQFNIEFPVAFWEDQFEGNFKTIGEVIALVEELHQKNNCC